MPKEKKKTESERYTVILDAEKGQESGIYRQTGKTPLEALNKIHLARYPKTMAVLTCLKGKSRGQRLLRPIALRKLMANETWREIVAKQFTIQLG